MARNPRKSRSGPSADNLDLLSIVERAYDVNAPVSDWTRGLLEAADSSFGSGLAGFACSFWVDNGGALAIDRASHAVIRQAPEVVSAIFDGLAHTPPASFSRYMRDPHTASYCLLTSETDPQMALSYRTRLVRDGIHDGLNIVSMGLSRHGVLISLGVGPGFSLAPRLRGSLVRIATHIVAAQRLRKRICNLGSEGGGSSAAVDISDAILSPEGKLLHVRGEAAQDSARHSLRQAVSAIQRARTSLRKDPEKALGFWKGLVSARWTVIDQFDAKGTKYIVACENLPASASLSNLTRTERCVVRFAAQGYSTKEIAYTLGLKDSTVRVLIMRALRRLRLSSRRDLLKLEIHAAESDDLPAPGAKR